MKTPEEIKKGILCDGPCNECAYRGRMMSDGGCSQAVTDDTIAYIQQLEAQVPRWISVEERLPEEYRRVLGTCCMGVFEAMYDGKYWRIAELPFEDTVTHWMPLPEAPKEE